MQKYVIETGGGAYFFVSTSLSRYYLPLGTVSFGAVGFMSIRNKSGRTLVNRSVCSADTWS